MVDKRSHVKCESAKTKKLLKQLARTGFLFFSDLANSSPNVIELYGALQRVPGSQIVERLNIGSIKAKIKRGETSSIRDLVFVLFPTIREPKADQLLENQSTTT